MSQRQRDNMVILAHSREQHRLSQQNYGRPRMTEALQEQGLKVGRQRVGRLMRENVIKIIRTQKWAGDISYIWTSEGWLYLALAIVLGPMADKSSFLDLYSRRVIGWAVSNRMKRELAIRALDMAVALRQPPMGYIHHTDRGSQYCSGKYQKRLSKHGFKVSMSGKGNCYDNAMVETFFKSLKAERIWRNRWETRRQAEGAIFQYINGFYNKRRRHSSLGSKSPLAFERKAA